MTSLTTTRELSRIALLSPQKGITVDDGQGPQLLKWTSEVQLGPSVFRKFICTPGCGACCLQGPLTLDFLPVEYAWIALDPEKKALFAERDVVVNGKRFVVMSLDKARGMCYFLDTNTKGCDIWQTGNPLGCWAAARIQIQTHTAMTTVILKKGFAREWRWEVRAQCQYPDFDWEREELDADTSVLHRYETWAAYFQVDTVIPEIKARLKSSYEMRSPFVTPIRLS